jgi:amino acid transporter
MDDNLMDIIRYILLGFSLYNLPLAAIMIGLYSYFHFKKKEETIEKSPDWVIADYLFGTEGIPVPAHKIIGIIMFVFSWYWINSSINNHTDQYTEFYPLFAKFVIIFIIVELSLKKIILKHERKKKIKN